MKQTKLKMFNKILFIFALVLTISLVFPAAAFAQTDDNGDQVVVGGKYRLRSGETISGNLIILGGEAVMEEDSRVYGDVFLTGGSLEVSGTIDGNIIAIGGSVSLLGEAVVKGDVNLTSAGFSRSPEAIIRGDIRNDIASVEGLKLENLPSIILPQPGVTAPIRTGVNFITKIIWSMLQILALSALAALVLLVAEKPTQRVAQSIVAQPLIAFGFGLLTVIVSLPLLLLLTITIILIPVGLIGIVVLAIAFLFGWIAVGFEIGERIEKALNQSWAPAITGGIGTLVLTLVGRIFVAVPCIGWIIPTLVAIIGLGGVLISRFGTQLYVASSKPVEAPVVIEDAASREVGAAEEMVEEILPPSEDVEPDNTEE